MKIQEIREIIKLVDNSSINEFTFESEGAKIELKKGGTPVAAHDTAPATETPQSSAAPAVPAIPAAATKTEEPVAEETPETPADSDGNTEKILSPMVGTFYQSPSPDEAPYVQKGTQVSSDQVVCIVEAMKLFNEIEAEVDGEIAEILVKDGQLVEYGQPLFLVKTN